MRLCAGSRAKRTLGGFGHNLFFEFAGLGRKLLVRSGAQKRVNAAAVFNRTQCRRTNTQTQRTAQRLARQADLLQIG